MSVTKKKLEELDVMDDFLMSAIASNPEVGVPFCRRLLSVLLQREIGQVRVMAQYSIPAATPGLRGIRMDVEVEEIVKDKESGEEGIANVYDVEPHLEDKCNLPRRNRFYQAKIDGSHMVSGQKDFSALPNLYVITITDYDPFGLDYMMYTIHNKCEEVPDMQYNDGLQFIYFYTEGIYGLSFRKL